MSDQVFKMRLMKNPREALKEHGIELPANVNLKVLEDKADTRYLILPRESAGMLSQEDLKNVAAGPASFGSFY
jgi:nitrile hydratase